MTHPMVARLRTGRDSVTDAVAGYHSNKASRGVSNCSHPETGSILKQGPCKQAKQVSLVKQLVRDTDKNYETQSDIGNA